MTSYESGQRAESAAAQYLEERGYQVIARNWRTRYCEIDIVAQYESTVYFVEVKHRTTSRQGAGFDYITPKKLEQMNFAARIWIASNGWQGEVSLAAVEVTGQDFTVTEFLANL